MTGDKPVRTHRGARAGLSLMELLVVLGIFSLTVTMATAIFLQSNQVQRRVLAVTGAQADLRFTLEALVREVRTGRIDYERYRDYGGVSIPSDRLLVKSANGQDIEFSLSENPTICPQGTARCLAVSVEGVTQSITSKGLEIDRVLFYVSPQVDPYVFDSAAGSYLADEQPLVTIAITARTTNVRPQDVAVFNAQTTVASRTYER